MDFKWTRDFNVICGTPAIGKSTMGRKYDNVMDLNSGPYRYFDYDPKSAEQNKGTWKLENPDFLADYAKAIVEHSKKYALVLLSIHEDVLAELDKRNIKYATAYSPPEAREIINQRFINRGNDADFIKKVMDKFDAHLAANMARKGVKITIEPGRFLEDALTLYEDSNI